MARLSLKPNPTFQAKVAIPVPGAEPVEVEFTFKHRNRAELKAFADGMTDRDDVAIIMDMAGGWDLADAFTPENLAQLVANYFAAPRVIFNTYLEELTKAKEKN